MEDVVTFARAIQSSMRPEFWKGRKVLLTGHTGFKGSWLSLWLRALGAEVAGYSLAPPTSPSMFEAARIAEEVETIDGDVRDFDLMKRTLAERRPEIVIHLAAQSLVRRSYRNPIETYETNVLGTVKLLEAVRSAESVRSVVVVTSDKCYENREWTWGYRENEPMGGHDPYSNSKGCAELVTAAFRNSFFNRADGANVASARAGNVIGGGDWAEDRLVPDIVRAIVEGRPVVVRNPTAIRPWQHVLEPLGGYLLLAEKLCEDEGAQFAEGWNFGPHEMDARPVRWIVERLTEMWGAGARWTLDDDGAAAHPHESHYLKLDCSKARQILGWQPQLALDEALDLTAAWYKDYFAGEDVRRLTIEQIEDYMNRLSVMDEGATERDENERRQKHGRRGAMPGI